MSGNTILRIDLLSTPAVFGPEPDCQVEPLDREIAPIGDRSVGRFPLGGNPPLGSVPNGTTRKNTPHRRAVPDDAVEAVVDRDNYNRILLSFSQTQV